MAERKVSDEVKGFIVQALACFDSPSVVAAAVKNEFGEVVSRQYVEGHDPTKVSGKKLAKRWGALFHETRKAFLEDASAIAISHRAVRLRALQRMLDKAETQGNMVLAASLLEQAAKEVGDSFTNRREHSGPGGGPIQTQETPARERLAGRIAGLASRCGAGEDPGEPDGG